MPQFGAAALLTGKSPFDILRSLYGIFLCGFHKD
jgi:hypothetical protein